MPDSRLDEITELVRNGRLIRARNRIIELTRAKLDRQRRLRLAYLANQAGLFRITCSLLYQVISKDRPTDEEKSAYATALVHDGAAEEGIAMLHALDRKRMPELYRMLALAHFKRWEWDATLPVLRESLSERALSIKDELSFRLLLGSALVHSTSPRFDEAERTLRKVAADARLRLFSELHWDALQMLGQCRFLAGDPAGAARLMKQARSSTTWNNPERALVADLFDTLVELKIGRPRRSALRELAAIRTRFMELGNWERARSCDFYRAIILKEETLLARLYYCTPFPGLQRKLLAMSGLDEGALPKSYDLKVAGVSGARKREAAWIDSLTGEASAPSRLKRGSLPLRLLAALGSDAYRPLPISELHGMLYPGERFHPVHSADRVWQAIKRLREWADEARFPLLVRVENRRCSLGPGSGAWVLRLHAPHRSEVTDLKLRALLAEAEARFPDRAFAAKEIEAVLGISRPTVVALLQSAIEGGWIKKVSSGPRTRYAVSKTSSS